MGVLDFTIYKLVRYIVYHPGDGRSVAEFPEFTGKIESVPVVASDDTSTISYLVEGHNSAAGAPVIAFMHGISDTTEDRKKDAVRMVDGTGCAVFVVGYRGYCSSVKKQSPCMAGMIDDAVSAVSELKKKTDRKLVFFGQSLGAAIALRVIASHEPDGIILENPFLSIERCLTEKVWSWMVGPLQWINPDKWDNREAVLKNTDVIRKTGVLVISATKDELVSHRQREELMQLLEAEKCPCEIVVLDLVDHANTFKHEKYLPTIRTYCDNLEKLSVQ